MKLLFTLLLAAFSLVASAQLPADSTTGRVVYRGALAVPAGVTQAQAFGRAKIWLADAFASKAVLAEDAASGLLSGGGSVLVKDFTYLFRVRLQVEGGIIRYRLDDFSFSYIDPYSKIKYGTPEEQRDSKLGIGKGTRARMLTELDMKVRAGLAQLSRELAGAM